MSIFNTSILRIKEKDPLRKTKIRALNNIKYHLQSIDEKVDNLEILEDEVLQKVIDSTRVFNDLVDARDEKKVNEIKERVVKTFLESGKYIIRGLKLIREDMEGWNINTTSELNRLGIYKPNVAGYYGDQLDTTGRRDWGVKIAKRIIRKELEKKDRDNSLETAISLSDEDSVKVNGSDNSFDTAISLSDEDSVKVNGSDNSFDTEASSIFGEDEDEKTVSDSSSVNSSNDNSANGVQTSNNSNAENDDYVEKKRSRYIERVKKYLSKRSIEESELEEKNRNWLEKIKATNDLSEMISVACSVEIDAKNKKDLKQQAVELDKIIEDVPALFENQSTNEINKAFSTLNESLGEEKNEVRAQRAKKVMINHDPEKYFENFINWVKEEEEKLEAEKKKLKENDTNFEAENSELEYNEEEKAFLKGEITDRQKQEEIAQQIEEKINVEKKSWSLKKWVKEQVELVIDGAKSLFKKNNKVGFEQKKEQIKQKVKSVKNSSNKYTRQAYQKNEKEVNNLLAKLDTISQGSQTVAPNEKVFFRPEIIVPLSLSVVALAIVATIVIRRRKLVRVKK